MEYFVYIIQGEKDRKNYIGSTSNIQKRLEWHNDDKNVSTRYRRPFRLIYTKEFNNKIDALKYEYWLKKQKGGYKVKLLIEKDNQIIQAPIA